MMHATVVMVPVCERSKRLVLCPGILEDCQQMAQSSAVFALLCALGIARAVAGDCIGESYARTDCARQPYSSIAGMSREACCERCSKDRRCRQWTHHGLNHKCHLTNVSESLERGAKTLLATCGVKPPQPEPTPAPAPAPAPSKANVWAVIAAGSKGFFNYRHQADACHAYQVIKSSGVPEEQIILMMQDDVAKSRENPFPGKLFNKPGSDSPDVYDGCKVDYSGDEVTAKLFLSVITGDASDLPAGSKVLKSGKDDRVFLNFIDHGGVGIIAFPNGPLLHAEELSSALKTMQQKEMFDELLFYMEACESGSMFPDLTKDGKIFAVTAANARESSYGYYCSPTNDTVHGKHIGSCLGDLFSISWMEDSDLGHLATETIKEQVTRVTARTTMSHVTTFGDASFEGEPLGRFELGHEVVAKSGTQSTGSPAPSSAIDIHDIPLKMAFYAWERSQPGRDRDQAWQALQAIVAGRQADLELFRGLTRKVCGSLPGCSWGLQHGRYEMRDRTCHKSLVHIVHAACPRRAEQNPGGWNEYNMQFSQVLVNLCESQEMLKTDTASLQELVRAECAASSRVAGTSEMVI